MLGADRRVYHAGDTVVTDELTAALQPLEVDVSHPLPVNGRDPAQEALGIVGNMNAVEVAELALAVDATRLVAYHWDGFAGNTGASWRGRGRRRGAASTSSSPPASSRSTSEGKII